jgi:hypothetical protein
MARYFMNLRDGTDELLDPEGVEYPSLDAVRNAVLQTVRDLMSGDVRKGVIDFRYRVDAENSDGVVVHSLAFRDAVEIIAEGSPQE